MDGKEVDTWLPRKAKAITTVKPVRAIVYPWDRPADNRCSTAEISRSDLERGILHRV